MLRKFILFLGVLGSLWGGLASAQNDMCTMCTYSSAVPALEADVKALDEAIQARVKANAPHSEIVGLQTQLNIAQKAVDGLKQKVQESTEVYNDVEAVRGRAEVENPGAKATYTPEQISDETTRYSRATTDVQAAQNALARAKADLAKAGVSTAVTTATEEPKTPEKVFSKYEYTEEVEKCEQTKSVAEECCAHPERCFGKPDGQQSDNDGITGAALSMAWGVTTSIPAGSVEAMCGRMKTASGTLSGINAYLGVQCSRYVSQCKKACGETAEKLRKDGWLEEDVKGVRQADQVYGELQSNAKECKQFDNQSIRLAQQAVSLAAAAKLNDMCKNANARPNLDTGNLFATPDCAGSLGASSAYCQAICSQAGAASNPECAGYPGLNGNGANNGYDTPDTGSGTNGAGRFSSADLGDEGTQAPVTPDIAAQSARSSGGAGGGGLSGLGGGGGDQGGGEGSQAPGADGAGYNTKIDRGLASGNGYSSIGGNFRTGTSGGGFSAYGTNSSAITNSGKPFSLKDFLPGNEKAGTKLAMRGPATSNADIAPAHADIFKKVTDRFYQVCARDGLYDCASLNRKKKTGT